MKKKCLVTGSTAVLGSAFKKLVKKKELSPFFNSIEFIFIGSKECDLVNKQKLFKFFKNNNFNYVIHLAAISGGMGLSGKNFQATLLYKNSMMLLNLLEACREFKIEKTLLTMSSGMYSPQSKMPYIETDLHNGPVHESIYGYFYSKRLMEPALRAYRDQYNMNIIALVPNGIFGENDNFDLRGAPLVPSLIRKFYEAKEKNSTVEVWGDGSPLREWTYSEDMAKAFLWCFEHYNEEKILNVGSTEENSIKDISFLIADIINFDKSQIKFDASKGKGVFKKSTDNNKFIKLSNFEYRKFREGLELTIKWFIESQKKDSKKIRLYSKI